MRRPFGYSLTVSKEVDVVILRPDLKWGRHVFGSRTRIKGRTRLIVAYTVDKLGRSIRVLYQQKADHAAYGDHNWPIEARQVADLIPGLEAPVRKPAHVS